MKKRYNPLGWLAAGAALLLGTGCYVHVHEDPPPPPCVWGYNGLPGHAFMGIDWANTPPYYVWTDNPAIPRVFEYNVYYPSPPGTFRLYYEVSVLEGCCLHDHYWDVLFNVWVNPGAPGGCGFNGFNGVDSYLMMICGPYGPWESRVNKTKELPPGFEVVSQTDDRIVARATQKETTVEIIWQRQETSQKENLDPKGVLHAQ